ncbi:MAG: DUF3604 domain-containing protein [Planctomycetota bacterium]|nr:MAG: DUF3604 domain-containing protein [Planctomycetota bacterium]
MIPLLLAALVPQGDFLYDDADVQLPARVLESPEMYQPGVAFVEDELWLTWLQFHAGLGDEIWVGKPGDRAWKLQRPFPWSSNRLARPTLTVDGAGQMWLSFEFLAEGERRWDLAYARHLGGGFFTEAAVLRRPGQDLEHVVCGHPDGGIWLIWQGQSGTDFDVFACRVQSQGKPMAVEKVSVSAAGDWQPSADVNDSGDLWVSWDHYAGDSFDVVARLRKQGQWQAVQPVAVGPAFQGRSGILAEEDGSALVLWEQGGRAWGHEYRSLDRIWNNNHDHHGPLHRFRLLKTAKLEPESAARPFAQAFPLPATQSASHREGKREKVHYTGLFYERGQWIRDSRRRPWLVYRHFYQPQLGLEQPVKHHIEQGWQLFARALEKDGWSKLHAFDHPQRDGNQRLSLAATEDGFVAAWATGRTDRRKDPKARGVVLGRIRKPEGTAGSPLTVDPAAMQLQFPRTRKAAPEPHRSGGREFRLYFGDLHRHTDLSLCFPFFDGSLNDAYRYALEVAELDFLGVTDHTRDIAKGNALSQLWWRSTKEVTRYHIPGRFRPFFAFERSHRDTDHNVISLREDRLRNFPPPLPEYWAELENDTLTIPHQPFIGKVWDHHDDHHRPLMEIYQGFRNTDARKAAHQGLADGHHVGFIASSDHLSTSASFAGVWAAEGDRESLFRALQARRTFAATDRIRMVFQCGEHWMGEHIQDLGPAEFSYQVEGTGLLQELHLILDGEVVQKLPLLGTRAEGSLSLKVQQSGEHFVYLHLLQKDGGQAWSSPIWFTVP